MEAKALTPRDLFDGKVCYEVPPFQRPYVWNEEDQWQPLWDDIARVTNTLLKADADAGSDSPSPSHFLGAVVFKYLRSAAGDPSRSSVIDGQQRLTTLQLVLDAAQSVLEEHGDEQDAESLQELVLNDSRRFRGTSKRFKLWPSRVDRAAFEQVMDNDLDVTADIGETRIAQAHSFFGQAIRSWAEVDGNSVATQARLSALAQVLQQSLQIVAIDLGAGDEDQRIFESLNDRGTPLLAADLIKNYVFERCAELGIDVDAWAEKYWQDFDEDWWRDQVAQGRLYRSRIDLFLQYWLTMRLGDEIPTDDLFRRFRGHAGEPLKDISRAQGFLAELRRDADTFRDFAQLDPRSAPGRFYARVVEALELGATTPLLLWLISDNHDVPPEQSEMALAALESWTVRRTLLRYTMKDLNNLVVALLRELGQHPMDQAGRVTVEFLLRQTADARTWPTDAEVAERLPEVRAYGNIKQQRLRSILAAIEEQRRSERHESIALPPRLEIEHVMPQQWRNHWPEEVPGDLEWAAHRDRLVNTLGNLTLVTQKLNGALSDRPWTDAEARVAAPTGREAGKGKRSLLARYSLLVLNKEIVDDHTDAWKDQDILTRGRDLTMSILALWPRGSASMSSIKG
jgi:hypothetical protein